MLVNSTTATQAIQLGSPTMALGRALFNLPGLTFQGSLDQFWTESTVPDANVYKDYRRVLIQNTQINGDFYTHEGIAMTIRNSLEKLDALPVKQNAISRTILITGASKGIGEALSYYFASGKTRLILVARNKERLAEVGEKCRHLGAEVITKNLDISHDELLIKWINEVDQEFPVDLLITNAGITLASNPDGSLESLKKTQELLQVNLNGTINAVNPIAERMRQRGKGQIAMVSSLAAYYGMPVNPVYSASKAAIKSYGEALRGLLKDQGVKVSVICPGFVETELSQQFPGKRPLMISADKAAHLIAKGLHKNKAVIAFPVLLAFGMKCLQLLPFPIASFFMGLSGFNRANKVLRK